MRYSTVTVFLQGPFNLGCEALLQQNPRERVSELSSQLATHYDSSADHNCCHLGVRRLTPGLIYTADRALDGHTLAEVSTSCAAHAELCKVTSEPGSGCVAMQCSSALAALRSMLSPYSKYAGGVEVGECCPFAGPFSLKTDDYA